MPKYKLILTVQDSFGMTKEIDGGTIDVNLSEALTSADVKHIEEALPLEDYVKKTELPEELIEYATDYEVENAITFTTDKFVTNSYGDFAVGDSVKGLTLSTVLAKLLGLSDEKPGVDEPDEPEIPEEPNGIIETILYNKTPMLQINENDEIIEVPYELLTYTVDSAATTRDGKTGFYKVVDAHGEIIEAGYQHYSTAKDPYYIVALPEDLAVAADGNTKMQSWNTLVQPNRWTEVGVYTLTGDYNEIVATYDADGIEPPVAPTGYRLWADLNRSDPGSATRFVIKE